MLLITAAKDKTVCNKTIEEFMNKSNHARNKLIDYPDADHLTITVDYEIGI